MKSIEDFLSIASCRKMLWCAASPAHRVRGVEFVLRALAAHEQCQLRWRHGKFLAPGRACPYLLLRRPQVNPSMTRKPRTVELTPLQIAQTLIALRAHIAALNKQEDEDPQGDEVQDILVAQSVVKILAKAGADADKEDYPGTQQP